MDMFGFKCAKNTLMILNVFYIIVGIILAATAGHLLTSNKVTSLPIIGGIVACGIFLIVISLIGIYGAARHHQVLLFFYMVVLFLIFFIQFVVACVSLGVSRDTQFTIARTGWSLSDDPTKGNVQTSFTCCGYESRNLTTDSKGFGHPPCNMIGQCNRIQNGTGIPWASCPVPPATSTCCTKDDTKDDEIKGVISCGCDLCKDKIGEIIGDAFYSVGVTSLLFSFTEIIGGVLAWRYRNLYANGLTS